MRQFKTILYFLFVYPYHLILFKKLGYRSKVMSPLKINGGKNISIGSRSIVEYKGWLQALPLSDRTECKLVIKSNVHIGHFCHIISTNSITIEDDVLIADKVYISDNLHGYELIDLPVIQQPIRQLSPVQIGAGSWLGENVCIIGASIGKHCVIGANSVVTKDVPDYSIAVGSPAKIIKRYNFDTKTWVKTDSRGDFLKN